MNDESTSTGIPPASPVSTGETTQAGGRRTRPPGPLANKPQLPESGEEVFGFRLRHELGRGAFAKVYLAEQADLAGRPVVLKISDIEGDEPQTLAQLQHTHIVPIYSVHENARRNLRAVCMPYFGGTSLSQVLERLYSWTRRPETGEEFVRALESAAALPQAKLEGKAEVVEPSRRLAEGVTPPHVEQGATPTTPGGQGGAESALTYLRGETYLRATAWIVSRLAEALQHAHQRGVLHRDIKPSNVLVTADGQPMLLDFNVSESSAIGRTATVIGGTVAYMAPEHLRALAATEDPQAPTVDHRADVYSLGMVLYEMLTGARAFTKTGSYSPVLPVLVAMAMERSSTVPSLRRQRADVPWGIESILRKCLAPRPAERYQRAEQLAEDLRLFLDDRPLRYAPELSFRERVHKWLRRHPRLTSSGSVAAAAVVLLAVGAASLVGVRDHLHRTREQLAVAESNERVREFEAGTVRALCLVNTTTEAQDHLKQGIEACEQTLGLFGVLDDERWQDGVSWRLVAPETRARLGEDTRELLLLLAWARVRTAANDPAVLSGALGLLDLAEAVAGLPPCRAVGEARASYLARLGRAKEADEVRQQAERISPATARDHYLLATTYARAGRHADAIRHLDESIRLNPRHYWSLVQRGICYQETGKGALAAGDFGACIGVSPDLAWGYFNRGYVLEQGGAKAEAVRDYTAAIARDPAFVIAYLNRGMAYLELERYQAALADFDRMATLGCDGARLHLGRGVALEGLGRTHEADAAFGACFARAKDAPEEVQVRLHWVYGMAVSRRLPDKARQAFDLVLARNPRHAQALYGRAMLFVERGMEAEALKAFDGVIEASPTFLQAWRYRAILRARAGEFARAVEEINWCLERDGESGATVYAAACVAALAAGKATKPEVVHQVTSQALGFLEKAFSLGYGRKQATSDPDLHAIRDEARFKKLLVQ